MSILQFLGGSLTNVLKRGVQRVLAGTIAKTVPTETLIGIIKSREPQLTLEESQALGQLVKDGQRAAGEIRDAPADTRIPLQRLPEDPYAMGAAPPSERVRLEGKVRVLDAEGNQLAEYQTSIDSVDVPTAQEARDSLSFQGAAIWANYDPRAVNFDAQELQFEVVDWDYAARRF